MSLRGPNGEEITDLSRGDTLLLEFDESREHMQANAFRAESINSPATRDRVRREGRLLVVPVPVPVERQARSDTHPSGREDGELYAANRLPDSASRLPLRALIGLVFAGAAIAARRLRSGTQQWSSLDSASRSFPAYPAFRQEVRLSGDRLRIAGIAPDVAGRQSS